MPLQKTIHCQTCPWIRSFEADCFDPGTLQKTVVADLQEGRVQTCHANHDFFCAGALSFQAKTGILKDNSNFRLALVLGIISTDRIDPNFNTFDSVEEMMSNHSIRNGQKRMLIADLKLYKESPYHRFASLPEKWQHHLALSIAVARGDGIQPIAQRVILKRLLKMTDEEIISSLEKAFELRYPKIQLQVSSEQAESVSDLCDSIALTHQYDPQLAHSMAGNLKDLFGGFNG
jgi:hypothetical protein